jgi:hypothetical protein
MRAVKDKYGNLQLMDRAQTALFNKVDLGNFVDISTLDERELYVAEDLHKKNVLQKVKKGHVIGYKIHAQRSKL